MADHCWSDSDASLYRHGSLDLGNDLDAWHKRPNLSFSVLDVNTAPVSGMMLALVACYDNRQIEPRRNLAFAYL
jgi:hypothetical protein